MDISQFHQVFFEESFEGLEDMERCLLDLDLGEPDPEDINTIFRAAHSIKGGSGTFGFKEVTDFTHVVETLLDQIRNGERQVSQEAVDLFLKSVDCLREMLTACSEEVPIEMDSVKELHDKLQAMMNDGETGAGDNTASASPEADTVVVQDTDTEKEWEIRFAPHHNIFDTGNDPLRLIRALADMGELDVEVNTDNLPAFENFEPEQSYLVWNLKLKGLVSEEEIQEVFEWVEDECDLDISPLTTETAEQGPQPVEAPVAANVTDITTASKAADTDKNAESGAKSSSKSSERRSNNTESSSIRVSIDKVDALINMVGELVITQSMLSQFSHDNIGAANEQLRDGLELLERNTRELQENVMQIRMLPISFSFNRFPRLVRDLSNKLGKKIELKLSGEQTELDKTVMEKIGDPLVHLVRNSLDHGIEKPEDRVKAGKPETGVLHLNAYHQGGNIIISINDDGGGLNTDKILAKAIERGLVNEGDQLSDEQVHDLIFSPGFSTADAISDVSGRGVGMDVVRRNIKDLGGSVEVESERGVGSTFKIRLPLTLAILDGQLVKAADETFIIPLISIIESVQVNPEHVNSLANKNELYRFRDEYIPIIRLTDLFQIQGEDTHIKDGLLVVVETDGKKSGIFVDDLHAQQQVVIKSLESNYQKVPGISGATILGNGSVAMILDIAGLMELQHDTKAHVKNQHINEKAA